jgi:hypothetical protein
MIDDQGLKRGYLKGWLWVAMLLVSSVFFFYLSFRLNPAIYQTPWQMGGHPFVPASSPYANGYFYEAQAGGPR